MNSAGIATIVLFTLFLGASLTQAASVPSVEECPLYEKRIHELSEKLRDAATVKRYHTNRRYVDFVNELAALDANTQLTLCADQDRQATLKFNTPEERRRDNILSLLGWVDWFGSQIADLAGGAAEVSAHLLRTKDSLGHIQRLTDKEKTKGLTRTGRLEDLMGEYDRLTSVIRMPASSIRAAP